MTLKLMVQGTTSDAGKSTLVAGLCRVLARRGIKVAPFKPQNMALNSAVTSDGGEIGRAQALQAQASGLEPHTDMNPVLLKPNSDIGAQVIVGGKAIGNMEAVEYHQHKPRLLAEVLAAFERLGCNNEVVLVEGAGSPAEINLRDNDIANMGFAEPANCPVIIIADIDKGGVFAHLYGTYQLLSDSEKELVKGFVINRFRGDISLLQSGLDWLEQETGAPVLGVIPYLHGLWLDSEDAIDQTQPTKTDAFTIVVPVLPRISNHTDFDPLRLHPDVNLVFARPESPLPPADLIILPGSKSVRADLAKLKAYGWDKAINRHLRFGGKIIGICGGYQMLGKEISDPLGIESKPGSSGGLGSLDLTTELKPEKALKQSRGTLTIEGKDHPVTGYQIHSGETEVNGTQPFVLDGVADGAISDDNQVLGGYLHGLFDSPRACNALLHWAGWNSNQAAPSLNEVRETSLNKLADTLEQSIDLKRLFGELLGPNQ